MSVGDRKRGVGNPRLSRKIIQPYIAAKGKMSGAEIQLDEAQPLSLYRNQAFSCVLSAP